MLAVLGFESCPNQLTTPAGWPSTACARCRPMCRANPSKNCSANSGSPTSSSWRRTKIRSARARRRWPRCSARRRYLAVSRRQRPRAQEEAGHPARARRAQITLGNGSNDLLVLLAEAFLEPGSRRSTRSMRSRSIRSPFRPTGATGVVTPATPADSRDAIRPRSRRDGARGHAAYAHRIHREP